MSTRTPHSLTSYYFGADQCTRTTFCARTLEATLVRDHASTAIIQALVRSSFQLRENTPLGTDSHLIATA